MGDESADNVAWSYEQPLGPVDGIKELIAFYENRVTVYEGD